MAEVVHLPIRSVEQDWMAQAACKGQIQFFFAPHGEQAEPRERREAVARAICASCPVIVPCREHARANRELGFWGGENDDERLEARRRERRAALRLAAEG